MFKTFFNCSGYNHVFATYEELIKTLEANDQIGTAKTYRNSQKSLMKFVAKDSLKFEEINVDLLNKYEKWMLQEGSMRITKNNSTNPIRGNSKNTVGMYLRVLRTIYNKGIDDGDTARATYPFGKNLYVIPTGRNFKRALNIDDVEKIMKYVPTGIASETLLFSKDIWIFTYLGNGINLKDIANLKYKNLVGDAIAFNRAKIEKSKKSKLVQIKIDLDENLNAIIKRWGNDDKNLNNYIFPILNINMDAKKRHDKVKQTVKTVNKHMKRIGIELGFDLSITTMVARHTFATIMVNSGFSTLRLAETMGNSEITARNYVGDSANNTIKEFKKALTAFNKAK